MWGRKYPHVILLIFVKILKVSCERTSSLSFVIDDTTSMVDDLAQVKSSVKNITDVVFKEKSSLIGNMVLTAFNDPDTHLKIVTKDRTAFERAVAALSLRYNNNPDCPEATMAGLILALENSLPGSYLYVFTDAAAKDYEKSMIVKELCQRKQSQITFVLTGYCRSTNEIGFKVFYDIAAACSGLVFFIKKYEVNQVFDVIKSDIQGNKSLVTSKRIPAGVYKDITFTIDEHTEYVIISAYGVDVKMSTKGPSIHQHKIMWNDNVKVVKLTDVTPGQYVVTVRGETTTTVYISGRTDFLFNHGFSQLEPKTLKDTTPQPIADTNVHLSVLITDLKQEVEIKSAQIMTEDEKPIGDFMPLSKISKDFYTTKPFITPSKKFKILIYGVVRATGKPIKRISKIPITPAKPIKLPNKTKPTAVIEEGKSIQVDYDSTVKLTCKVTAYPKPKISWIDSNGVILHSMSELLQAPYDYISYLTIPNMSKSDKYICYAINDLDKDSKTIQVKVKDAFEVNSIPREITKVNYGSEGTIICDIRSSVPMRIHWFYADENTGANGQIITGDKYSITADGTQLKIKKMDLDLVGRYTCEASLIKKKEVAIKFRTRVEIDGLIAPKVSGLSEKKITKGLNGVLECTIVKGVPKPTIHWQFMGKTSSKFVPIGVVDSVLRINNVQEKDAGRYKCVATNAIKSDEHITTLVIQDLPKITSRHSTTYQGTDGDARLRIPCDATGFPKPDIIWKLNGHVIAPNEKFSVEDGALIIKDLKVSDANSYTCEAKNEVGSVTAIFQAHILQAPKVSVVTVQKVRLGKSVSLECTVLKGEPKPIITWKFIDDTSSTVPTFGHKLYFAKVENKDAGRYMCVAENKAGRDERMLTLIVESPPRIISKPSTIYGIEGDIALRIPCEVGGIPKPFITWKLNGSVITSNSKYIIEDNALVVMDPKLNDTAAYTCEAKNYIGSVSETFEVIVQEFLQGYGTIHHLHILQGENRTLECEAYKPTSNSQSVQWFFEDLYINRTKPYMLLENTTMNLDGNYTCRVSDIHGHTETHTYRVNVGFPPKYEDPISLNEWRGNLNYILQNCHLRAKPSADVIWNINGKVFTNLNLMDLEKSFEWGHYTCNISNVHGFVFRSFDVTSSACLINVDMMNIQNMPLLLTEKLTWPTWKTTGHYSIVPQGETVTLSCSSHEEAPNAFQKFPERNILQAVCEKEDKFLVVGKPFRLTDLSCSHSPVPSIVRKKVKCTTESSELIRVGYYAPAFVETFEVCLDHAKRLPVYSRVLMTKTIHTPSNVQEWYEYPGLSKATGDTGLTCKHSTSSCCYGKSQLVNAKDFNPDAARTTFSEPLNAIPYWRPCDKSMITWEDIDEKVRSQLNSYDQILTWSGTHTLQEIRGAIVPRYLWKVLKYYEDDSIAIIHVNDPSPTNTDIKCKNICEEQDYPWSDITDEYTYCCELSDFLEAFDLRGTDVGVPTEMTSVPSNGDGDVPIAGTAHEPSY